MLHGYKAMISHFPVSVHLIWAYILS